MADGFYQLTYRDLANRLGISPDAARMKANRKAKAGLWRFLPDEGPGQERRVEIPAADLDDLPVRPARPDAPEAAERVPGGERAEAADQPQAAERPAMAERPLPAGPAADPNVRPEQLQAAERIEPAERSVVAIVPPAERPIAERIETPERAAIEPLAAEPAKRSAADPVPADDIVQADGSADPMVKTLAARVSSLTDRLLGEIEGREKDRAELEATQAREQMLKLEIERLCNRVSELTNQLDQPRRPWWRDVIPGGDKR